MKANTLITTSFCSSIPYNTQKVDRYILAQSGEEKAAWHLRWDAVDADSSVNPFSAQSLGQFDHSSLGRVVGKLLLGMGDCRAERKPVNINGHNTAFYKDNIHCIIKIYQVII